MAFRTGDHHLAHVGDRVPLPAALVSEFERQMLFEFEALFLMAEYGSGAAAEAKRRHYRALVDRDVEASRKWLAISDFVEANAEPFEVNFSSRSKNAGGI